MENQIFEKNNEKNNILQDTENDPKTIDYLNFTRINFYDNNIDNNDTYNNTYNNNNNQNQYQTKNQNKLINLIMNETNYDTKNMKQKLSNK